jgi:hypothetical protein
MRELLKSSAIRKRSFDFIYNWDFANITRCSHTVGMGYAKGVDLTALKSMHIQPGAPTKTL